MGRREVADPVHEHQVSNALRRACTVRRGGRRPAAATYHGCKSRSRGLRRNHSRAFAQVGRHSKHARSARGQGARGKTQHSGMGGGIDQTSLDGCIELQKRFDLPDTVVRAALRILRANERYPSGPLHDLTLYPVEVKRAFSPLASAPRGALDSLVDDLKRRTLQGARSPDESPGGPYSQLERESANNIAVLATIELFQRRREDPGVKEVLAALRRGRP